MNILCKVTLENLKKNKVRTLVTIIGIILSATMITAVLECGISMQRYMINIAKAADGNFYGGVFDLSGDEVEELVEKDKIVQSASLQSVGFALYDGIQNQDKPYIYVGAMGDDFEELVAVNITSGRMPENSGEILIPSHLSTNGGVSLSEGDVITLELGTRVCNGKILTNHTAYMYDNETLDGVEEATYTVVGFYDRFAYSVEAVSAPGYTALTVTDGTETDIYDVFFTLNNIKNTESFLADNYGEDGEGSKWSVNSDLLLYSFVKDSHGIQSIMYSFMAILIVIIMFGSITLIYNAFSISVSERTKQFGILKSVGATRRQMMNSVFFETFVVGIVGIPLGLICGCVGIGTTFYLIRDMMSVVFANEYGVSLTLYVHPSVLVIAAVIAFITIIISAYIPARRANKISAIDAIRQTNDISIKQKNVKTSKLGYRLFGFEGMIASKNFKRNKKKYRATVWSLFASIVLFVSTSGFCAYMQKAIEIADGYETFDLYCSAYLEDDDSYADFNKMIRNVNGVTSVTEESEYLWGELTLDEDCYTDEYIKAQTEYGGSTTGIYLSLCFVNDSDYQEYLEKNNFDVDKYMNAENPIGLLCDNTRGQDYDDDGNIIYYAYSSIKESALPVTGDIDLEYAVKTVTIGGSVDEKPYFLMNNSVIVMYPYSAFNVVAGEDCDNLYTQYHNYYILCDNHSEVYEEINKNFSEMGVSDSVYIMDYAAGVEQERMLVSLMKVFSYGFITLISLIAVANVFNTISTNIMLRRREFAMLRAVGITNRGFNKMMNYECILYGVKGLVFGIPAGVLLTYALYASLDGAVSFSFFVPAYSIIISVAGVFLIVFITMLYSMRKVKKDNTIDALKNENL